MLKNILSGFLKNWELWLFVIIIGSAVATYYTQKGMISYYKKLSDDRKSQIETLKENNNVLTESLNKQNQDIDKFKSESDAKNTILKQLQKDVDKNLKEINELTSKLKSIPPPKNCQDSMDYFKNLGDYVEWEN